MRFRTTLTVAAAALALSALLVVDAGCKGKSKNEGAKKTAPAPVKKAPPAKPNKNKTPKVRGRSLDWGTLAKKQPKQGASAKKKVTADAVVKAKAYKPLATLKTIRPTGLRAVYLPSKDKNYDAYRQVFQEERIFDLLADELNKVIKFPRVIDIQMSDCGTANAFYDDKAGRIIMCYELLAYYLELFSPTTKDNDELGTKVIGATLFVFFHELGHALRHQLNIPVTGSEEVAVDELATLLLIAMGDDGIAAAFSGAEWFALEGGKLDKDATELPFWGEHALDQQRFYNITCLIYGSAPKDFDWLVKDKVLPGARADVCPRDYKQKTAAWDTLLKDHFRADADSLQADATTKPPPPRTKPKGGGPPCQVVANHIARLTRQAFRIEISKLSPADQQAEKELFVPQLNNFKQTVTLDCRETWAATIRKCALKTTKLADLDKCGGKAPPSK